MFIGFDWLIRFIASVPYFDSLIRFIDSIHWFDSLIRFIDSIHRFDSLIRFIDSIHWNESMHRIHATNSWMIVVYPKLASGLFFLQKHWKKIRNKTKKDSKEDKTKKRLETRQQNAKHYKFQINFFRFFISLLKFWL